MASQELALWESRAKEMATIAQHVKSISHDGAEEEHAGFTPASSAAARIALFRACHYPPAKSEK